MVETAYPHEKSRQAFRTISEVAKELDVPQHVLRFWETKFAYVKPMKRGGNRRYYRPEDVVLLQAIRHSLYSEGYTIKGVQKLLKDNGTKHFVEAFETGAPVASHTSAIGDDLAAPVQPQSSATQATNNEVLQVVLEELKALRKIVDEF